MYYSGEIKMLAGSSSLAFATPFLQGSDNLSPCCGDDYMQIN